MYVHATRIRNAAIRKWKCALTFWEIRLCSRILHAWYHHPGVLNLLAEDCRRDILLFKGFHAWRRFLRRRRKRDERTAEHDMLRCVRWAVMQWTGNASALREERGRCRRASEHRTRVCLKRAMHVLRWHATNARVCEVTAELHCTRALQRSVFSAWRTAVQTTCLLYTSPSPRD